MAVGHKRSDNPDVWEIGHPPPSVPWAHLCCMLHGRLAPYERRVHGVRRLRYLLYTLAGRPAIEREMGYEDYEFPGSKRLLQLSPQRPHIVHTHNLHGNYFDLRCLPQLSRQVPVVMTLHDAWLVSGHCAHSFECDRWRTGCGACPDISIYPPILRDATAYNWRRKRQIYRRSRLFVSTPCAWLMHKVEQSMLAPACAELRVIPYGVDLAVFRPQDKLSARLMLELPREAKIMLFAANGIHKNPFKDYVTMRAAIGMVAERLKAEPVLFVALGEQAHPERVGAAEIRFVPYQQNADLVARYYQAADVYVHAAKADTFPNVVLEALASGLPAVATAVGGIPEQIRDGETGFLVPAADGEAMATRVEQLLRDDRLRLAMSQCAAQDARQRYDLHDQATSYLGWYREILEERKSQPRSRSGVP